MSRKPIEFEKHPLVMPPEWEFRAFCRYVVDGDTFDGLVDLGFYQYAYETIRVRNLDTPELVGVSAAEAQHAREAKQRAQDLLLMKPIYLKTYIDPTATFGRFVADVYYVKTVEPTKMVWQNFADQMKAEGFQKRASY